MLRDNTPSLPPAFSLLALIAQVSASQALSFLLVGAFWGCTNPLLKRASTGIEIVHGGWWAELWFLVSRPQWVLAFLLNQCVVLACLSRTWRVCDHAWPHHSCWPYDLASDAHAHVGVALCCTTSCSARQTFLWPSPSATVSLFCGPGPPKLPWAVKRPQVYCLGITSGGLDCRNAVQRAAGPALVASGHALPWQSCSLLLAALGVMELATCCASRTGMSSRKQIMPLA